MMKKENLIHLILGVLVLLVVFYWKNTTLENTNTSNYNLSKSKNNIFSENITDSKSLFFTNGFIDEYTQEVEKGIKYTFKKLKIADLKLNSGKIVISEPFYYGDNKPLDKIFKPGLYPVYLSEALIKKNGKVIDKRNALVKIQLSNTEVIKWKFAGSFTVDGGTAGFIDYETMQSLIKDQKSDELADNLLQQLEDVGKIIQPFENNYHEYRQYVNIDYKDGNLVAFSSGFGDGGYSFYFGINKENEIVEILIDFEIIL